MAKLADFQRAAERTINWAVDLIDADGFRGCRDFILGYYKAPCGLLAAGRAMHASHIMQVVERRFFREGDFRPTENDHTPPYMSSYFNGWFTFGAHRLGAYHISGPALDRLERSIHPEFGGVPDNLRAEAMKREHDSASACSAANALLAGGRVAAAVRIGEFLKSMFDGQDAAGHRVLFRADANGRLIDPDRRELPKGALPAAHYVVDVSKPDQVYWMFGFAIRIFAQLFQATGEQRWLDTAERIHGWLRRCDADLTRHITNGKVGWGAAEMYAVTGDPDWRKLALDIADWLIEVQASDGVWVRRPQFESSAQQPLPVSLDTSIERMFYMLEIPRAIASRDGLSLAQ